jgi:hypothetical protein
MRDVCKVQLPLVDLPIGRYGHNMLPIENLETIIMFGGQSGLQRKNFSLSMKTSAEVATNFISGEAGVGVGVAGW